MNKIKNTTKYSKNVLINNILLLLVLLVHSALYFSVLGKDVRFSIVAWGLWAFMSIPFVMLFLANYEYNHTEAACNIILVAIVVLALNSLVINIQYVASNDPLAVLIFFLFPLFAMFFNVVFFIIAEVKNKKH